MRIASVIASVHTTTTPRSPCRRACRSRASRLRWRRVVRVRPLALPQLGFSTPSGLAQQLRDARHSREEAGPSLQAPSHYVTAGASRLQSRRFLNRWSPTCSTAPARDFRHLTRQLAQNTATRMTSGSAVSCAKIRAETVEPCSLTLDLSLTLTLALAPALALALALPSSGPDLGPRLPAAEAPRARLVGWLRLRAPRCRMRSRNLYTT